MIFLLLLTMIVDGSRQEIIDSTWKSKQFVGIGVQFERICQTKRSLKDDEKLHWTIHHHDGRMTSIDGAQLTFVSFSVDDEGLAICQVKNVDGTIIEEKFFFITHDPTELIDERFEGSDGSFVDVEINRVQRRCGPDPNIEFSTKDIADFHIDFVQHYERVRLHADHIFLENVQHQNEGHYECVVRLNNGLVGVRVFFLNVAGGPREISRREKDFYAEVGDSVTLLCPIFSALPARYSFLPEKNSLEHLSSLKGYDYLRITRVASNHSGIYTCRATIDDDDQTGYSMNSQIHLTVFGPPEYHQPHLEEYVHLFGQRNQEISLRCSISAHPRVTHFWFHGDIRTVNQSEIIANGTQFNANQSFGTHHNFTCIATNNRGQKRQVFVLEWTP